MTCENRRCYSNESFEILSDINSLVMTIIEGICYEPLSCALRVANIDDLVAECGLLNVRKVG